MATNYCSDRITTTHVMIAYVHSRLSEEGVRVPALECRFGAVPQRVRPIVDRIREYDDWVMSQPDNGSRMRESGLAVVNRESDSGTIGCGIHHVLDSMFCDGKLSFGRFVAVVMFVNQMCMSAIAHGHSDKITEIVNWVAFYFTRHGYDQWIEARGGWECGMLTMRPIADREPAAGHPVVAAQPEAEQQVAAQNRQMDPLLQAALTGTVFLGSVIASVLNAMNRQ